MLHASALRHRSVIDLSRADKVGTIEDLLIDLPSGRVLAVLIKDGPAVPGGKPPIMVPASAIEAFGEDAVTIDRDRARNDDPDLSGLVKMSDLLGRKVISRSGTLLGVVGDMLLETQPTRIVAFGLREKRGAGALESLLNPAGQADEFERFLQPHADLRIGDEMLVAPDEAVADAPPEREDVHAEHAQGEHGERTEVYGDVQITRRPVRSRSSPT